MNIDRIIMAFASIIILASVLLAHFHHANWLWLTAFVGANLLQAAFTGFCPAARIVRFLGARPGVAFE
jgi:hypothetical protein